MNKPDVTLVAGDVARIEALMEKIKLDPEQQDALEEELSRATIIRTADTPEGLVIMGSSVTFEFVDSGEQKARTLCYPQELADYEDSISIFAPVGSALIGLKEGDEIEWPLTKGSQKIRIVKVKQKKRI